MIANIKKMEIHSYFNPILDLLLHMAYGNIFSTLIYLGGKSSFYIGVAFLGLYGIILILQFIFLCIGKTSIFTGLIYLLKKCRNFRTFEEAINERRKLPPLIIINKKTSYQNYYPSSTNDYPSGENEIEYEYCTWEDNTDFILDNECSILECQFDLEVNLDKETKDNLELFKKEIENKRTSINDDIKYIETVNCPDFNDYETCFLKAQNFFEKILPILWFISFITGYLNIIDIFINYKFEKIYVKIKKAISNTNLYRAKYK